MTDGEHLELHAAKENSFSISEGYSSTQSTSSIRRGVHKVDIKTTESLSSYIGSHKEYCYIYLIFLSIVSLRGPM